MNTAMLALAGSEAARMRTATRTKRRIGAIN
jgi:hypothetical protein